jgi:hypothetical protein
LPTLVGLGLEYVSRSGFFQATLSGRLDIEGVHFANAWTPPPAQVDECEACHASIGRVLRAGDGTFQTHRLRLLADLFLGDHVYSLIEIRGDRGLESLRGATRGRLEQAFVRVSTSSGSVGVQVGRFASPFGSFALRHLTSVDPFVGAPLVYDYRTVANRWRVPGDAQAFLSWQDQPHDVDFPGAPPVWEVPYQWGAMFLGRVGAVSLRAAAMNSAPSSNPNAWALKWSRFERPSWVVAARWSPTVSLELGASYDRGPWLEPPMSGTILAPPGSPPGSAPPGWRDFDQELIAFDVAFARGATMLRAEAIVDRWEMPNVGDVPRDVGVNVEAQHDLAAGLFVGLRGGWLDFRPLDDGLGGASPYPGGRRDWDRDVVRWEGAMGYRLTRNAGVLLSGYRQVQRDADDGDTSFLGLRLWWEF